MQKQTGSKDCGVFAIGVLTALLNGVNPSELTFNTQEMRDHLLSCFTEKSLTHFPAR
uniref:Ubiquitin-like protease family profile domain-containing protein n=1 Tax=Amphimedon queenslandica TaxID=400682 RepID=A0A1X7SYA7_AMPQE